MATEVKIFFTYCGADQRLKDCAFGAVLPLKERYKAQDIDLRLIAMDKSCVDRWDIWSRDNAIECDIMVPIITEHSFELFEGKEKVMLTEIALGVEHSKRLVPLALCPLRGETKERLFHTSVIYATEADFSACCEELANKVEILILDEAEKKREREKLQVLPRAQKNSKFVGRSQDLERLAIALEGSNIAVLMGEGGIGKTTLAEAFFEKNKERFFGAYVIKAPDGIKKCFENLFVDEKSKTMSPDERHDNTKKFIEGLNKKTVIIFDNCDVEMTEQDILDELDSIRCKAIITSRDGISDEEEIPVLHIGRMDNDSLLELVHNHYKEIGKHNKMSESELAISLKELFDYVDGHTLTVEMASAIMREGDIPISAIKEKLLECNEKITTGKEKRRARAFDHLGALYDFARLSEDEKRILNTLCLISPLIGIERADLKALLELDTSNEINDLARKTLLRYNADTRCASMHPLFADVYYKAERVSSTDEYLGFAEHISKYDSDEADLKKNESILQICLYFAKKRSMDLEDKLLLGEMYNTIGRCFSSSGDFVKSLEYKEKALEARLEAHGGDQNHAVVAESYNNIGFTYGKLGNYKRSLECMKRALEIWSEVYKDEPNHPDISLIYNNIGFTCGKLGKHDDALEYLKKALDIRLEIFKDTPNHPDVALTYNNIGRAYGQLGNHEMELEYLTIALDMRRIIYKDTPNHPYIALTLNYMGGALDSLGRYKEALERKQEALNIRLEVYKDTPNHPDIGISYRDIGTSYKHLGKGETALEFYKNALVIFEEAYRGAPSHPDVAEVCDNIAECLESLGRLSEAEGYRERARAIREESDGN